VAAFEFCWAYYYSIAENKKNEIRERFLIKTVLSLKVISKEVLFFYFRL